jgi:hypothetical protein
MPAIEREDALAAWLADRFSGFTVRGTQPPDVARVHREVAGMLVEWFDAQQLRVAVDALREIAEEAEAADDKDYPVDPGWLRRRARKAIAAAGGQ